MGFAVIQNIGGGAYEVRARNIKTFKDAWNKLKHLRDHVDEGQETAPLTVTRDNCLSGIHRRGREGRLYAYSNGESVVYKFS